MQEADERPTAALALADGSIFAGIGFGASGAREGELVFNTAMTGYQEILTDPSYAEQIITFTFPHIGNVGTNEEDVEAAVPFVKGLVVRELPTAPSNWRSEQPLSDWLVRHGVIGIAGIDTRALTAILRARGAQNAALAHDPGGDIDKFALCERARSWSGLIGADLTPHVADEAGYPWDESRWSFPTGHGPGAHSGPHIVVIDYGVKRNILRALTSLGCRVSVLPPHASIDEISKAEPDGIVLANGPGDPAATGIHAVHRIRRLIETGQPIFGICLGHQLLGLALGTETVKMPFGHHGANHPVKDLISGRVEITSQNHGFAVADEALPEGVEITHRSLFDGTIQGLRLKDRPVFSVQYHPEASPGPMDSSDLFERFVDICRQSRRS